MRKFILLSLLLTTTRVFAQFSGQGSGTEKDPYQVSNADELFEVRNDLDAYYVQTADIDLTTFIAEDNPILGWSPIGTEATPFTGQYDGKNYAIKGLLINRQSIDCVGLFGYTIGARFSSIMLISPKISGNKYVGGIVGYGSCTMKNVTIMNSSIESKNIAGGFVGAISTNTNPSADSDVSGCVLIDGYITGTAYAGGIIGTSSKPNEMCNIAQNYINANIEGDICGGIVAKSDSYYHESWDCGKLYLINNSFLGVVNANSLAGGIIGSNSHALSRYRVCAYINKNVVSGSLYSKAVCGGIVADDEYNNEGNFCNNVAVLDTISGTSAYRITDKGVTSNNFASSSMVVIVDGKPSVVDDNDRNGLSYGLRMFFKKTTYEGFGFDFTNDWSMIEGVTLPYPNGMTHPCTITSFTAGSKACIEGTASGANKVYIFVNGNCYEAFIIDGKWSINVGTVAVGTKAKVSVMAEGKQPSISVEAIAKHGNENEDVDTGDANGDGTVDAVDVVSIINYILGKPSSSFNANNADTNGDGQILVDDAVETVNKIIKEQ